MCVFSFVFLYIFKPCKVTVLVFSLNKIMDQLQFACQLVAEELIIKKKEKMTEEKAADEKEVYKKKERPEVDEKAKIEESTCHVKLVRKEEYTTEVTKASSKGLVICCLFAQSQTESNKMLQCLESLAKKFKACKFVKILGHECIDNYPDENCPTLLLYKNQTAIGHIKGLQCFGGLRVISPDVIEWEFARIGAWKSQLTINPRNISLSHTNSNSLSQQRLQQQRRYKNTLKSTDLPYSSDDAETFDDENLASDLSDLD
ncbi:phosducin-like protein [Reticulomyxa filosa]|uniref:Phosducin-like protein n=1 Tax=Reticulomyxa filosa TaxID=46433 RepID=X6P360_RETFI|nr:phosducin-like protein [Reticulomyxa filosa]|eukprot:ETO32002.1 phosducin-like protein [Reticulomyxa filosa]